MIYTEVMESKMIWLGMTVGSVAGNYIPSLWGDTSVFSMASLFFSAAGGFLGIWLGWRLSRY